MIVNNNGGELFLTYYHETDHLIMDKHTFITPHSSPSR